MNPGNKRRQRNGEQSPVLRFRITLTWRTRAFLASLSHTTRGLRLFTSLALPSGLLSRALGVPKVSHGNPFPSITPPTAGSTLRPASCKKSRGTAGCDSVSDEATFSGSEPSEFGTLIRKWLLVWGCSWQQSSGERTEGWQQALGGGHKMQPLRYRTTVCCCNVDFPSSGSHLQ